jgi:hypothetical protein
MLLFRPPLQRFGRPGVAPAFFGSTSPLADDQPGLADRASAEWLWTLLPPLPSTGATTVNDQGGYGLAGAAPGVHTQAYRGLVMPLAGAAFVYESSVVTDIAVEPEPGTLPPGVGRQLAILPGRYFEMLARAGH